MPLYEYKCEDCGDVFEVLQRFSDQPVAVHEKCGERFWQDLVARMRGHFLREDFTQALLEAIEATGELLARHFPKSGGVPNELPDEIAED